MGHLLCTAVASVHFIANAAQGQMRGGLPICSILRKIR